MQPNVAVQAALLRAAFCLLLAAAAADAAVAASRFSNATSVESAQQLADAVEADVPHILVVSDLDFTGVANAGQLFQHDLYQEGAADVPLPHPYKLAPSPATKSIRGKCTSVPGAKCTVSLNAGFINLFQGTAIWLDNLALRVVRASGEVLPGTAARFLLTVFDAPPGVGQQVGLQARRKLHQFGIPTVNPVGNDPAAPVNKTCLADPATDCLDDLADDYEPPMEDAARLFLTRVDLIGDGIHSGGIIAQNARIYAEDSNFTSFVLLATPGPAVTLGRAADAAFVRCTFANNSASPIPAQLAKLEEPVLEPFPSAPGGPDEDEGPGLVPTSTPFCFLFAGCTFDASSPGRGQVLVAEWEQCAVQTDKGFGVEVGTVKTQELGVLPVQRQAVPIRWYQSPAGYSSFLSTTSQWLLEQEQEVAFLQFVPAPEPLLPPAPPPLPPGTPAPLAGAPGTTPVPTPVPIPPGVDVPPQAPAAVKPVSLGALVGIVVAAAVLTAVICAFAYWVLVRKRRRGRGAPAGAVALPTEDPGPGSDDGKLPPGSFWWFRGKTKVPSIPEAAGSGPSQLMLMGNSPGSTPAPSRPGSAVSIPHVVSLADAAAELQVLAPGAHTHMPSTTLPGLPSLYSDAVSKGGGDGYPTREEVTAILDALRSIDKPFPGGFRILPAERRWETRLSVVQPAQGEKTRDEVALEFFLSESAMHAKLAWYAQPLLRTMLPTLILGWRQTMKVSLRQGKAGNEDEGEVGALAEGRPEGSAEQSEAGDDKATVPPFIVTEGLLTLEQWQRGKKMDFVTAMQVLFHVSAKLKLLHATSYVHRRVSPSSIIWLVDRSRWSLSSFDCMAKIGDEAELGRSLQYAAPEVAAALEEGSSKLITTPAMDIWALGVVAMELFTGQLVFPLDMPNKEISDMLTGRVSLPWAEPKIKKFYASKLQVMEKSVLSCLQLKPEARPSAQDLHDLWTHLLDASTTEAAG